MIWECEIRNSEFEKREGRKPYYAPNPLRGGASKGGRGGRGEYGVETDRKIDCWRLGNGLLTPRAVEGKKFANKVIKT